VHYKQFFKINVLLAPLRVNKVTEHRVHIHGLPLLLLHQYLSLLWAVVVLAVIMRPDQALNIRAGVGALLLMQTTLLLYPVIHIQ